MLRSELERPIVGRSFTLDDTVRRTKNPIGLRCGDVDSKARPLIAGDKVIIEPWAKFGRSMARISFPSLGIPMEFQTRNAANHGFFLEMPADEEHAAVIANFIMVTSGRHLERQTGKAPQGCFIYRVVS